MDKRVKSLFLCEIVVTVRQLLSIISYCRANGFVFFYMCEAWNQGVCESVEKVASLNSISLCGMWCELSGFLRFYLAESNKNINFAHEVLVFEVNMMIV